MYIIIAGGGQIGYCLGQALLNEGYEILIIENDAQRCQGIEDELGSITLCGDSCEVATLIEAGTSRADALIAVTDKDEDNLVACQLAKYKFNVPRTIARLNNPKNKQIFPKLGVDYTVSVVDLILEHIEWEIPAHRLIHLLDIARGALEVVEVRISESSLAIGKAVRELSLPSNCILSVVVRDEKPEVVTGDTVLEAGDEVVALTATESEASLRRILTGS